jgi:hypothetical protein
MTGLDGNAPFSHVYVALLHYPVYDKNYRIVATSITNYDIHDISRVAATYALGGYFMVTPLLSQQELCRRIIRHWVEGFGSQYNQTRQEAFSATELAGSLQEVLECLRERHQSPPKVIMTSARESVAQECHKPVLQFPAARQELADNRTVPYVLVFGTGYGVEDQSIREFSDCILEPVYGNSGYNHLSVRSAAAIIIDRLFGQFSQSNITS